LTFTAVHALAVNSAGDIYAGTFGGGVMKLEGGTGAWASANMPYDFVWALAIDGNDKIYAGTYGGGVYVSEDDGGTWTSNNDGLANQYIYSITVNPNDEVFASAWAAGVYKLNDSKDGMWSELGMNGVRVTSVSSGFDGYVYAATEDGRVYRYMDKPLGAEEESETVTKFDLAQNYPNPFNPTTQISFSVAKAGNYELAVYNMLGQKVATLVNGNISEGEYNVRFDAGDLASGIYIYRLQGEGVSLTKKMMLMK
jgi:ligand-binding sensor domain-containing protein